MHVCVHIIHIPISFELANIFTYKHQGEHLDAEECYNLRKAQRTFPFVDTRDGAARKRTAHVPG